MPASPMVLSADYAEALLSARRAKNILFAVILLLLFGDMALFFVARYGTVLNDLASAPASKLQYVVGLIAFLGIVLPVLLSIVIYLMLKVLLVGRLLGSGRMTSAFLWSAVLILLLFPWQSILNNPAISSNAALNEMGAKVPGVLYTWSEFSKPGLNPKFNNQPLEAAVLHWARYVGFPSLSILILLMVQTKSRRALRQAMVPAEPLLPIESPSTL